MNHDLPFFIDPLELNIWLKENDIDTQKTNNIDLRIIDLSSEESYIQGHIPGAIHLPFRALMSGEPPAPGRLPGKDQLDQIFSNLGLNENTHFIVYDDEGGGWAGRFIWTLDVIGHRKYTYIDGGILAWKKESLTTETIENKAKANKVSINIDDSENGPIAEIPYILKGIQNKSIQIWDARSPQEYRGEKVLAAKGGHIPGAISCEWTSLMDPNNGYRLRKDAEKYLLELGIHKNQNIVTHCQSHHRSGFTYIVGKHLGFNIQGYHGSWSEWGNHPSTPIEI